VTLEKGNRNFRPLLPSIASHREPHAEPAQKPVVRFEGTQQHAATVATASVATERGILLCVSRLGASGYCSVAVMRRWGVLLVVVFRLLKL